MDVDYLISPSTPFTIYVNNIHMKNYTTQSESPSEVLVKRKNHLTRH